MLSRNIFENLIYWCGLGQILLVIGSLGLPKFLSWSTELSSLTPATRQMFWVYSGYIWATNLSFGVISTLSPEWLTTPHPLSVVINSFICVYWGARVLIQFFYFDRSIMPKGILFTLGEIGLNLLFIGFTLTYGLTAFYLYLNIKIH